MLTMPSLLMSPRIVGLRPARPAARGTVAWGGGVAGAASLGRPVASLGASSASSRTSRVTRDRRRFGGGGGGAAAARGRGTPRAPAPGSTGGAGGAWGGGGGGLPPPPPARAAGVAPVRGYGGCRRGASIAPPRQRGRTPRRR